MNCPACKQGCRRHRFLAQLWFCRNPYCTEFDKPWVFKGE